MKKVAILLFCAFFYALPAYAYDQTEIDLQKADARKINDAIVGVVSFCNLTANLKNGSVIAARYFNGTGTGWFVKNKNGEHLAITAGHVVYCGFKDNEALKKFLPADAPFAADDISSFSSVASARAFYKQTSYAAEILDISYDPDDNDGRKPDYALLKIQAPADLRHHSFVLLAREGTYGIWDKVVVWGYAGVEGTHILIAGEARITAVEEILLQINYPVYPSMSGSPVLFWKDGQFYAVAVINSIMLHPRLGGVLHTSWATHFKKEFFEGYGLIFGN